MTTRPATVHGRVLTSDGRVATIRTATAHDAAALVALHDHLDDETLRLRFFNVSRTAARHYVDHLVASGPDEVISLVAEVDGEVVGLGTAEMVGPSCAEVAFVVADDERGHGLGTLLLEHLAHACTELGVAELTADVLPDNDRMAQVFHDAGYTMRRHLESGVLHYRLSTEESTTALTASRHRRETARARWAARHRTHAGTE